jgi:hypothetical protein
MTARLAAIGWRGMREPLIAYLSRSAPPGALWQYREVSGRLSPWLPKIQPSRERCSWAAAAVGCAVTTLT